MTENKLPLARRTVEGLDNILGESFAVLDFGFVRVIDYMGDDSSIVQAARVSYGDGTKTPSDDRSLIRYLLRHWHTTPFEMCEIKLHLKMPIFVARQWIRHRTASINEYSGRYSIMPDEFYVPDLDAVQGQSLTNRQGREGPIPQSEAQAFRDTVDNAGQIAFGVYDKAMEAGVARELARVVLPLGAYTEFYWKIDLHNLMHFLRLRLDPHAQTEIRAFAVVIYDILKAWVPVTATAFEDYRLGSAMLSKQELTLLRDMLAAHSIDPAAFLNEALKAVDYGLSKREIAGFINLMTGDDE